MAFPVKVVGSCPVQDSAALLLNQIATAILELVSNNTRLQCIWHEHKREFCTFWRNTAFKCVDCPSTVLRKSLSWIQPPNNLFHKEAQELEEGSFLGWLGELCPLAESTRPSNFWVTRRKYKSYKMRDVHSGPGACDKPP